MRDATPPNPMAELLHRIKVFVFQQRGPQVQYLLLKPAQGLEAFWGPVQGSIGFGEKLESAIRREVLDDVGLVQPLDVIDLGMPARWNLGDEDVVEWTYGFRTLADHKDLRLDSKWADFRWLRFPDAYPSLELDADRAAILRLHALLHAA